MSGTVVTIHQSGSTAQIALRKNTGKISDVTVNEPRLFTGDGQMLSATQVAAGDTLAVRADGSVLDISDVTQDLTGIVASAPDPNGGPLILQVTPSRSILVDIDGRTQLSNASGESISLVYILDSDQVRVRGVLNRTLGEMITTTALLRLGP